jgi:hypothetical protein
VGVCIFLKKEVDNRDWPMIIIAFVIEYLHINKFFWSGARPADLMISIPIVSISAQAPRFFPTAGPLSASSTMA